MLRHRMFGVLAASVVLTFLVACDDDETGPEEERFAATLTGQAERPTPVNDSPATGTATVVIRTGPAFDVQVTVNGQLKAAIVSGGTHIHGPADANAAAGVILALAPTSGVRTGTIVNATFSAPSGAVSLDSIAKLMRAGLTYVNVHTTAHPGGEIRGQLRRQ